MVLQDVSLKIGVLLIASSLGWHVLKNSANEKGGLKTLGSIIGVGSIILSIIGVIFFVIASLTNWSTLMQPPR